MAIDDKRLATIFITLLALFAVFVFSKQSNSINQSIENSFYQFSGQEPSDSNIIIIHITTNDIENLGDWPLKRSYYALLIQNLTKLNVNKIGLEVFLSDNITSQSIYNSVLNKTIQNSKKVVLSSIAENISKVNNSFIGGSVILPAPSKELNDVVTGHINIIKDDGIIIPNKIKIKESFIKSFSAQLSGKNDIPTAMEVNFSTSWRKFKNYSLLEFFEMIENSNPELNEFANKIIIIGVSDPLIAKSISTGFDEELPGVGLHAIALNNLLTGNWLNNNFKNVSFFIFGFLALLVIYVVDKKTWFYYVTFLVVLLVSYLAFSYFQIKLNYIAFFIPVLLGGFVNWVLSFFESKQKLSETITEKEILKHTLAEEEKFLISLREKLNQESGEQKQSLLNKISILENEVTKLRKEEEEDTKAYSSDDGTKNFEGIIYKSKKIDEIVNLIKKVAPENASVLIMGESGSGKELVAHAIHNLSKRKDKKFVIVNCAALPDNLLESELFGHVKGAFTDAIKDKAGRFEEANHGTLFLDEIGETSENFQVKLLRVLQSGDYQKVGSSQTQHADVRIVAATNKNLKKLVVKGEFREDLFYRLNVITIEMPPLNDRPEDIEILAEYFAKRESSELTISKAVMKKLIENNWKGNVRELESVIKRAAIFAKSDDRNIIKLKDLPLELAKQNKSDLENMILESLREKKFSHSSINETAKELGDLSRTIISENFRGIFFRYYCENNFNLEKAVELIAGTDESSVKDKVRTKGITYLKNIEKDLKHHQDKTFEEIKNLFVSKYKNLPQKYHLYLDKIIQKALIDR